MTHPSGRRTTSDRRLHLRIVQPRIVVAVALCVYASAQPAASADPADQSDEASPGDRLFTLEVLPLLKAKCFGCHGDDPKDVRGELNLLTRAGLLKGGESGEASIIPGKPSDSPLYRAVLWDGLEMPPKENDRLTKEQTEILREWILAEAPWPNAQVQKRIRETARESSPDGMTVATSGGTSEEWTNRRYSAADLWAFLPVKKLTKDERTAIRAFADGQANVNVRPALSNAIDYFVSRRLEEARLRASDEASARTLIRRATFDLTGLPPAPERVGQFERDFERDPENAWSALIDQLLASPRYGERWARHWLDVTRYADTGGMSNDFERSNMWRYRDYVIRAFNNDKPYNQFVVEQLAGDELADRSVRLRRGSDQAVHATQLRGDYTSEEAEWIVATAFLRVGPWDNAMIDAKEARQIYLDDLVNVTGQTFLATTMRCCKCHDHKFDPLPTRDYYRMYAAFAATQMAERPVPHLPSESRDGFERGRKHVQRMLAFAVEEKNKLVEKREAAARAWFEERGLPYKNNNERRNLPDEKKPPRHVGLDYVDEGRLKVREQDEWIWTRRLERYEPMAQSVFNAASAPMVWNAARKLRINRRNAKKPVTHHILLGGALTALGDAVRPGVLSAVSLPVDANPSDADPYVIGSGVDGRRLALAKWIAHEDNALATRAIVNRIWQHHFGTGIAANANNFGAKGAKPSHPRLLDTLAADFVENGWTMKRLHRAIMMSSVYRRSSSPRDVSPVADVDPNNRWLSFFPRRRLSAEEIRDGILAVTGELQQSRGGLPVSPEINMEVALQPRMIQFSLAPAYQPSRTPAERNRRTVYAYHVRGQADPFTEIFNQPNPNESCELREAAAVTPQVFTLLNSQIMTARSIALALRLQRERKSLLDQIDRAFGLVLARHATAVEKKWMEGYVRDMRDYQKTLTPQPERYPTEITRSVVEEFSGRPFQYKEILPTFNDYVADKGPADVSAKTRALADMCLLLFNTNEFLYVD